MKLVLTALSLGLLAAVTAFSSNAAERIEVTVVDTSSTTSTVLNRLDFPVRDKSAWSADSITKEAASLAGQEEVSYVKSAASSNGQKKAKEKGKLAVGVGGEAIRLDKNRFKITVTDTSLLSMETFQAPNSELSIQLPKVASRVFTQSQTIQPGQEVVLATFKNPDGKTVEYRATYHPK